MAAACKASQSSKTFRQTISLIAERNKRVDFQHALDASFHFDKETFIQGRQIITEGLQAVKASNKRENYETARQQLGEILHPLQVTTHSYAQKTRPYFYRLCPMQDFYSHSNWVEIGNTAPNSNLIKADTSIGNIAGEHIIPLLLI